MNLPMNNQYNKDKRFNQIINPMNNPMMNQINYGVMNNPMINQMNYGVMNNPMMNQMNPGMINNPQMMNNQMMNKMILLMNILMNNCRINNQMNNKQMINNQMNFNNQNQMNNNNNNQSNFNKNQINNQKNNSINSNNNVNINKPKSIKQNNDKKKNLNINNSILSSRKSIYNLATKAKETNQNHKKTSFSDEEIKEIKEAFDLFDVNNTGKINPKELIQSFKSLEFDKKNPDIYRLICSLDTPEALRKGGITFEDFINAIDKELGDTESEEGIRRVFNLFKDDPNSNVITLNGMKKVSRELGENSSDEELKDMLIRASKNGKPELTFEEFYEIMKNSNSN